MVKQNHLEYYYFCFLFWRNDFEYIHFIDSCRSSAESDTESLADQRSIVTYQRVKNHWLIVKISFISSQINVEKETLGSWYFMIFRPSNCYECFKLTNILGNSHRERSKEIFIDFIRTNWFGFLAAFILSMFLIFLIVESIRTKRKRKD